MSPIVTVVMSVFNEEKTISRAIESIIEQVFYDWEMIIIDDASSDSTSDILKNYTKKDERINFICNEKNLGLAASLNRGIRLARGKYIARMDADDFSYRERLKKQIDFLEKNQDIDVLGTGAELIDKDGAHLSYMLMPEHHQEICNIIHKKNPFFHSSVVMKKEFINRAGGYNERLRKAQDYELWGRMCYKSKFHNLQEPLICYQTYHYKRPLKTLIYGMYVHLLVAKYNHKAINGGMYALLSLLKGLLVNLNCYTPRSLR